MRDWMDEDLDALRRAGLYRRRRRPQTGQGPRLLVGGRELVNFSSNDYLALAGDPRLAAAAARAAKRYGTGAGASALVTGHLPPLAALERELADWEGTEAALVFAGGYVANLALVGTLAGREDAVFSDALNHASLIDGCRLSRAAVHIYRHADANHLADLLARAGGKARRRLIVSDTVFSMDGDLAPLADLYDLAHRHDTLLVLDEAHATGVLGEQGRGLTEVVPPPLTLEPDRVIRMGTLSKALGAQGGFVCGSRRLVRWLVNRARPYVFSTALAPPLAAAARRAVRLVRDEPARRRRLHALATRLRARLGLETGTTPIVPVIVGGAGPALALSRKLERQGLLVPAIRPPSVPPGTARLRVSLTAAHSEQDVDRLADALRGLPEPRA